MLLILTLSPTVGTHFAEVCSLSDALDSGLRANGVEDVVEEASDVRRGVKGAVVEVDREERGPSPARGTPLLAAEGVTGAPKPRVDGVRERTTGVRGAARPYVADGAARCDVDVVLSESSLVESLLRRLLGGRFLKASWKALSMRSSETGVPDWPGPRDDRGRRAVGVGIPVVGEGRPGVAI